MCSIDLWSTSSDRTHVDIYIYIHTLTDAAGSGGSWCSSSVWPGGFSDDAYVVHGVCRRDMMHDRSRGWERAEASDRDRALQEPLTEGFPTKTLTASCVTLL